MPAATPKVCRICTPEADKSDTSPDVAARPHPRRGPAAPGDQRAPRRRLSDLRWPEQRLTVECDGAAWHDGELAREDDAERQARLETSGERVLRVTWRRAVTRPQTLARLTVAGAPYTDRQR
jgi:hypothetical protein